MTESTTINEIGKADPVLVPKTLLTTGLFLLLINASYYWCVLFDIPILLLPFSVIAGACFFIPLALTAAYGRAFLANFHYTISNRFVEIHTGVITRKKTTIPFSRIQNVSIVQGPFDRLFKLYTVKIETAGLSAPSGQGGAHPEGLIMGVKDPSKIQTIIDELVNKYTQQPLASDKIDPYIFKDADLSFDQFIAYIMSKMREGDNVKTKIKQLREGKGMSQQDLAEKVGVTRQTILYLEKGTYNPSLKLAMKIARVFDVSIEDMFELDDSEDLGE